MPSPTPFPTGHAMRIIREKYGLSLEEVHEAIESHGVDIMREAALAFNGTPWWHFKKKRERRKHFLFRFDRWCAELIAEKESQ